MQCALYTTQRHRAKFGHISIAIEAAEMYTEVVSFPRALCCKLNNFASRYHIYVCHKILVGSGNYLQGTHRNTERRFQAAIQRVPPVSYSPCSGGAISCGQRDKRRSQGLPEPTTQDILVHYNVANGGGDQCY